MKKIFLLSTGILLTLAVVSQTLLLDPMGDGGFENGPTFEDNGWTVENYTQNNQNKWWVGAASMPASGARAAYISDHMLGWNYNYQIQDPPSGSRVLFWRDVTFPAGEAKVTLSFKLRVNGYPDYDEFAVYVQNSDVVPNLSVQPSYGGVLLGTTIPFTTRLTRLSLFGDGYVHFSYTLNPHDIGNQTESTTRRFIFLWCNDHQFGAQPPASVDEIMIISELVTPMSGVYFVDNSLPTSNPILNNGSDNFNNLSEAISHLNVSGISGPVTINVTAGQEFWENPPPVTARGTAENTITFSRFGEGPNPTVRPTGNLSSNPYDYGICISGGRYITFDGIDVDGTHANTVAEAIEYGYLIRNWSPEHGAQYNTIKNCAVTLRPAVINNYFLGCIFTSTHVDQGGHVPSSPLGANSYNKFYNLNLQGSHNGIYLSGNAAHPDINNEVGVEGEGCQTSKSYITNIGSNFTSSPARGVYALRQNGIKVFNNYISNVRTISMWAQGIVLERCSGVCEVYNNIVNDISERSPSSQSRGVGIEIGSNPGDPIVHAKIYNNFVYDIKSPYAGSPSALLSAIGIYARIHNESIVEVDNNSVYLRIPGSPNYSIASFAIATVQNPVHKIRGNIFVNEVGPQTAPATNVCWFSANPTIIGAPGSYSDFNDMYFVGANTGAYVARGWINSGSSAYYSTINDWNSATGHDGNSVSVDPLFYGPADLHATAPGVNAVANFEPQAWVTLDIDCEQRSNFTPHDLGADAFDVPTCPIPTSLTINDIGFNTANLSWVAPTSATPTGYDWEVRYEGAAGSGPSGLVASGSTVHPNVSASVSGLENGIRYTFFVRSDCGSGDYSPWASNWFNTPTCNAPGNFAVSAITKTTATISWTTPPAGSPQAYVWEVRSSGEPGSGPTGLAASGSVDHPFVSANVEGLEPGTNYSAYVRSDCDGNNFSQWMIRTFTTVCGNFVLNILEGFNTTGPASVLPDCWTQQFVNGNRPLLTKESAYNPVTSPEEGTRFLWWNSYNYLNGQQTRLVSPPITTTGINNVFVSFYWFNNHTMMFSGGIYLQEGVQVQYSFDAALWFDAGEFIQRHDGTLFPGDGVWNLKEIALPANAGNQPTVYVGFLFRSSRGDNCSMDNLMIWTDELPVLPGDANCDGAVNILDVITIANYILGSNPEPFCFENADINNDGAINVNDLIATVNIILGDADILFSKSYSADAHIRLNETGIDLISDGTIAGLEFEIYNVDENSLELMLPDFEFLYNIDGNKLHGLIFSFDKTPIPSGKVELFRLNNEAREMKWGNVIGSNLVANEVKVITNDSSEPSLLAMDVYPNPTNGNISLRLSLEDHVNLKLQIFDMKGQCLFSIYEGSMFAGEHILEKSLKGKLSSGIYLLKLEAIFQDQQNSITSHYKIVILD